MFKFTMLTLTILAMMFVVSAETDNYDDREADRQDDRQKDRDQESTSTQASSTTDQTTQDQGSGDEGSGDDGPSCKGRCNQTFHDDLPCGCNDECHFTDNCCNDYQSLCVDNTTVSTTTTTAAPPRISCTAYSVGDPHYRTCDGHYYNWQGPCDYVFAKDCRQAGATQFEIQTRNSNPGPLEGYPVTLTMSMAVKLPNGDTIETGRTSRSWSSGQTNLRNNQTYTWQTSRHWFGQSSAHPYYLQIKGYRKVVVVPSLGVRVQWDGWFNMYVDFESNSPLHGSMCGLVGDGDGDRINDAMLVQQQNNWQVSPSFRLFGTEDAGDADYCHTEGSYDRRSTGRGRRSIATPIERQRELVKGLIASKASAAAQRKSLLSRKRRTGGQECSCDRDNEAAAFCSDLAEGGPYNNLCPDQWDIAYFDFCRCDFCYDLDSAIATIDAMRHVCTVGNQTIADTEPGEEPEGITFPVLPSNGFELYFGNVTDKCGDGTGNRANGTYLGNGSFTVGQCIAAATLEKAYTAVEYTGGECVAHEQCAAQWECDESCDEDDEQSFTYVVPTWAPTPSPTMSPTASPTMSPTTLPTPSPTTTPSSAPTGSPTLPTLGVTVNGVMITLVLENGTTVWSRSIGDSISTVAHSGIGDTATGQVYVVGETTGDFGFESFGSGDGFVVRLNIEDGSVMWAKQIGTGDLDAVTAATLHSDGDLVVSGTTHGTLDQGSNSGGSDGFVAKYGADGTLIWASQYGTSDEDAGGFIDTDSSGKIVVYAYTLNGDAWDILFTSFDSLGNLTQTKIFPLSGSQGR